MSDENTVTIDEDDVDAIPDNLLDDDDSPPASTTPVAEPSDDTPDSLGKQPQPPAEPPPAETPNPSAGERARGPDGKFIPKPAIPSESEQAATVAPLVPPAFKLPDGGQPFAFKVDGEDVALEGVIRYPEGVFIPAAIWDGKFGRQYLGSRQRWQETQHGWRTKEGDYTRAINTEKAINDKMVAEIKTLLEGGPDAVIAWAQEYEKNAPLMLARLEGTRATQELAAYKARQQDEIAEANAQAMVPRLKSWLTDAVSTTIAQTPELAVLGTDPNDIKQLSEDFYSQYGVNLYWEADRDYPEFGIAQNQILVNPHALLSALQREAAKVQQIRSRVLTAKEADARNQAALKPSSPSSPAATTRARPPAPPARPAAKKKDEYADFEDKLLSEDWSADLD